MWLGVLLLLLLLLQGTAATLLCLMLLLLLDAKRFLFHRFLFMYGAFEHRFLCQFPKIAGNKEPQFLLEER